MSSNLQDIINLHASGKLLLAKKKYEEILISEPDNFIANHLLGSLNIQLKNFSNALNIIKKTILINPSHHAPYNNLGVVNKELGKYSEAIENFNKAIKIKPDYAECYNNLAIIFRNIKKYSEAIENFNKAIKIKPDYAEPYNGIGILYSEKKNFIEAERNFNQAILLKKNYSEAINNIGKILLEQKKFELALEKLELAIKLNNKLDDGSIDFLKLSINDWSDYNQSITKFKKNLKNSDVIFEPFISLNFISSNLMQKEISQKYITNKFFNNLEDFNKNTNNQKKIRIGYYSADFHNHATAHLMSRFFELHNKENFETFAFSFGPNINDRHRKRLVKSFDKFFNVEEENDLKIIELSRENQIDIAVDLKGFTKDHRLGIFAKRVAPIQVSYLGYPGTIGASFMDYIVADKIVIPKKNQNYFSEKIIYLPHSYQVNDNTKEISGKKFKRKDFNLPNNCFIFCCFNNSYKINPVIFNVWMNILKKSNNSILWLLEENSLNKKNILKEAKNLGVLEDRIIFADRIKNEEHLARHKLADLFLDTLPYNAHTTASDALWSGLPILTCLGKNFQGRVAASLLNSVGLSNLITKSLDEYERLAIQFAIKEKNIIDIKNKLYNNLKSSSLFNTEIFTYNIEKAYKEIYERYKSNLKPDNIIIK